MSFFADAASRFVDRTADFVDRTANDINDALKPDQRISQVTTWKIISIVTLIVALAITIFSGSLLLAIPCIVLSTLAAIVLADTCKVSSRLNELGFLSGIFQSGVFLQMLADDTILLKHLVR